MMSTRNLLPFFSGTSIGITRLCSSIAKSVERHLPAQKKVSDLAAGKLPHPYDGLSYDNWLDNAIKDFILRGGKIRSQAEIDEANEKLCPGYTKSRKESDAKALEILKMLSQKP